MEGLIVNQFELNFQYVDGVKSVESQSIQQIALIKLSFYPGTDMAQAMAEVVGQANRAQAFMPPGVLPPQIMRMDAGSVPIGYLVLTSKTVSLGMLADLAQQRIRPLLQANVPGHRRHGPLRLQRALHRRQGRSRAAADLQPHARRRGQGPDGRQRHRAGRQPVHQGPDAAGADQRHDRGHRRVRARFRCAAARNVYIATWPASRTAPTSILAMPWWTASARSTCRWSRRTPPRP